MEQARAPSAARRLCHHFVVAETGFFSRAS